jgi:hypothetical protein
MLGVGFASNSLQPASGFSSARATVALGGMLARAVMGTP